MRESICDLITKLKCDKPVASGTNKDCFLVPERLYWILLCDKSELVGSDRYYWSGETKRPEEEYYPELQAMLDKARSEKIRVPKIAVFFIEKQIGKWIDKEVVYMLQTRLIGETMLYPIEGKGSFNVSEQLKKLDRLVAALQEHFDEVAMFFNKLSNLGFKVDLRNPGNYLYDPNIGFSLADPALRLPKDLFGDGYFQLRQVMEDLFYCLIVDSDYKYKYDCVEGSWSKAVSKKKEIYLKFARGIMKQGVTLERMKDAIYEAAKASERNRTYDFFADMSFVERLTKPQIQKGYDAL